MNPLNTIDLLGFIFYFGAMPQTDAAPQASERRHRADPHPASTRGRVDPYEIAHRLAPFLRWDEAADLAERSWRLVARTPEFDAWLIAWPSGGSVALHDHGASRGALSVLSGTLVETVPHWDERDRFDLLRCDLQAGVTLRFDAGHIHDVVNEGSEPALSLHVYSPALTSMTMYDVNEGHLVPREVRSADEVVEGELEPVLLRAARQLRLIAQ
jgi:mannose-6-phosphate isomerase-like protein (cupin superfamily)